MIDTDTDSEPDSGSGTDSEGATVVVVDDNESIADTYTAFLEREYDVATVYDGQSAIDRLASDIDVVLLDRRMPGISGDKVLEAIDERELDCRVVMLTAVDPEFDIVDMPFDEYVVKPVNRQQLTDVVDEMVGRAQYDDDFRQFLALLSKKATLEAGKDSAKLTGQPKYRRIVDRIDELRDELGVDTEDIERIFTGDVPDIDAAGAPDSDAREAE